MRRTILASLLLCGCVLAAPTAAARADEEPSGDDELLVDGTVRAGWRLLSGRGRGRFLEDVNLGDGPRIFDLDARLQDLREQAFVDEIEVIAHDIGERESDGSFVARHGDTLRVDGGYARDLFTYAADGDPYPRDTTRERSHAGVRFTPHRGLALRLGWDRSDRSGEAFAQQRITSREVPVPPGVDPEIVSTVRPFDERFDTYTFGADAASGPWRLGATASYRRGRVDDERRYDVPPDQRGPAPVSGDLHRRVRSEATTVVGKVGRTFLDGAAEATLFVTQTWLPVDADLRSHSEGFDNAFDGTTRRGAYTATATGDDDIDRRGSAWELDASWQVLDDVEILASGGQEDLIDDAVLDAVEHRRYARADVPDTTSVTHVEGRTTYRVDRASVEALWDVHDDVRLRGGYEWLWQDTKAPFETQGDALEGSHLSSDVHRIVAGIDADPLPGLSASVLARVGRDDAPPATPSFGRSDEVSARVRWRADERLTLQAYHRHRGLRHDDDLDSLTRGDTTSLRGTWSDGPLAVQAGATRQVLHTESDTRVLVVDGFAFRRVDTDVAYDTRDVVLDLHASYDLTTRLHASAGGHHVRSTGDEELTAYEAFTTLALDLSDDVTLGLTGRLWRYDGRGHGVDDYDAEALEAWLELRF